MTALTDARELAPLIVESPLDLVITDLHMPNCDGFGVLDILTPLINHERLPVLVVTGDASLDARQQALTRGAKDFVTKPFDTIEVMLRVRNLLESRMLFQDLRKQNRTLLESASGPHPRAGIDAHRDHRAPRAGRGIPRRRDQPA